MHPLWTTVWKFFKKLEINLPYELGIYPEKATILKDMCIPMFIAALFTTAKKWKQPTCPDVYR